jgi:hypothetical protein
VRVASAGQHQSPVSAQDLDPAEAPAEALSLQRLERQGHDTETE